MTETKHTHPWDEAIDNGPGWKDSYTKQVDDKAVRYDSNIEAPETQLTYARLTFPDGSRLYFGTDGTETVNAAIDAGGEIEGPEPWGTNGRMVRRPKLSWTDVPDADASRALGEWLKPLFDAPISGAIPEDRYEAVRALASDALGYVQAGQSDPALYRMLSALCRALDGDDADALAHLGGQRAKAKARAALADHQREAWGITPAVQRSRPDHCNRSCCARHWGDPFNADPCDG